MHIQGQLVGITWIDSLKTLCKKDSLSSEHMIVQSCLHTDPLKSSPICEMLKGAFPPIPRVCKLPQHCRTAEIFFLLHAREIHNPYKIYELVASVRICICGHK